MADKGKFTVTKSIELVNLTDYKKEEVLGYFHIREPISMINFGCSSYRSYNVSFWFQII